MKSVLTRAPYPGSDPMGAYHRGSPMVCIGPRACLSRLCSAHVCWGLVTDPYQGPHGFGSLHSTYCCSTSLHRVPLLAFLPATASSSFLSACRTRTFHSQQDVHGKSSSGRRYSTTTSLNLLPVVTTSSSVTIDHIPNQRPPQNPQPNRCGTPPQPQAGCGHLPSNTRRIRSSRPGEAIPFFERGRYAHSCER